MILDVKEYDIVGLEFKHVCLYLKRVQKRCARKCLEKFLISKHSFYGAELFVGYCEVSAQRCGRYRMARNEISRPIDS